MAAALAAQTADADIFPWDSVSDGLVSRAELDQLLSDTNLSSTANGSLVADAMNDHWAQNGGPQMHVAWSGLLAGVSNVTGEQIGAGLVNFITSAALLPDSVIERLAGSATVLQVPLNAPDRSLRRAHSLHLSRWRPLS
jgi:hypothetical protein